MRSFRSLPAILLAALSLSACGLTPSQKFGVVAGVLIVGAIAAHEQDNGKPAGATFGKPALPCHLQPDGSCR